MGLLVECPECKRRNNAKAKNCKCGFALAKFSGRVWWIEYYDHDKRLRRERIGPNKAAAEQRCREVMSARTMPRGLPGVRVFTYSAQSVVSIRESFITACRKAGIEGFTFHDLRHTFINNRRVEGHDYFRIMVATGHKTMSVFKRYNTVSKDELQTLVNGKSE